MYLLKKPATNFSHINRMSNRIYSNSTRCLIHFLKTKKKIIPNLIHILILSDWSTHVLYLRRKPNNILGSKKKHRKKIYEENILNIITTLCTTHLPCNRMLVSCFFMAKLFRKMCNLIHVLRYVIQCWVWGYILCAKAKIIEIKLF